MKFNIISLLILGVLSNSQLISGDPLSFRCAKTCQGVCASPTSCTGVDTPSVSRSPPGTSSFANLGPKDPTYNEYNCANISSMASPPEPIHLCCATATNSDFSGCATATTPTDIVQCVVST